MAMVAIADIGMIFVRCRGGVSHHPDEHVEAADADAGARVLLRVIENFPAETSLGQRFGSIDAGCLMKPLSISLLLLAALSQPALAQNKPPAKRPDVCAPIGKTEDNKLVYSLQCDTMPTPVVAAKPPGSAAPVEAAPAEEKDEGGLFRNPFPSLIKPTNTQRMPGVGPSGGR